MGKDSRRSDRHHVRFQLAYDDGEAYHVGIVKDLSHHGVFLETATPLPVGSVVNLTSLETDAGNHFEVSATVRRVEEPNEDRLDPPGMALDFIGVGDAERVFLEALIERLEEAEAVARGERDPFFGKALPRTGLARSPSGVFRPGAEPGSVTAELPSAPSEGAAVEGAELTGEPHRDEDDATSIA